MKTFKIRWMIFRLKWITFRLSVHTIITNEYNFLKKKIQLYFKKREADQKHKINGTRYHVIACGRGYKVVDSSYIDAYNRIAQKKIDIYGLLKMSFYSTSTRPLTQK